MTIRLGNGNGSFATEYHAATEGEDSYSLALGDINGDGVLDAVTGGTNADGAAATIHLSTTKSGVSALLDFSLKTKTDSFQAMSKLDQTLQNLGKQRSIIGAFQSRVQVAIANLTTANENFQAAESRIKDAYVASVAAELTRVQILQQAATAVLGQANLQPKIALSLLR